MKKIKSWINSHSAIICGAVALVIYLIFLVHNTFRVGNVSAAVGFSQKPKYAFFAGTFLLSGSFAVILANFVFRRKTAFYKVFAFVLSALLLAWTIVFPPTTVPDEDAHYESAYRMSNYMMFHFEQSDTPHLLMRESDREFLSETKRNPSAMYYVNVFKNAELISHENELVEVGAKNAISNAPFGFIISGLGIAVARLFHLGPLYTFYMGRLFNMAFYVLAITYLLKRLRFGHMAIAMLSLLPMSLHVISSYSYDGVILLSAILFVFEAFHISRGYGKITDLIVCALSGLVLAPSKLVYVPLLLALLVIPAASFSKNKKKAFLLKYGILAVGCLSFVLVQMSNVLSHVNVEGTASSWASQQVNYSFGWALAHPKETFRVFLNTLSSKDSFFLGSLIGNNLSWFTLSVPMAAYLPWFIFLPYALMKRDKEELGVTNCQKIFLLLLIVASFLLIFASMFVSWTPEGYPTIEGVQGRYFLPLLPLLYLIVQNRRFEVKSSTDPTFFYGVALYSVIYITRVFTICFVV